MIRALSHSLNANILLLREKHEDLIVRIFSSVCEEIESCSAGVAMGDEASLANSILTKHNYGEDALHGTIGSIFFPKSIQIHRQLLLADLEPLGTRLNRPQVFSVSETPTVEKCLREYVPDPTQVHEWFDSPSTDGLHCGPLHSWRV